MKATFEKQKVANTIKMALFISYNVSAIKGSKTHENIKNLLDWISQFDADTDEIIIISKAKHEEQQ